ncbi:ATPase [Fibrobacter sp. UWEL]|uniref:ATPase n=1 Tax=Fibrobacter sp. UWEL TaxID=1896209 RepID=UPI0009122BD0|nr:ATPase [Fibrobacter sp. UWEL]SHL41677.1 Predicted ABC-type ATPase [Fibrobacter sp. UWEL]
MKRYILFAGCNGVGKSTLYQTNEMFREMPRVNMDEIVREFGSWKNEADAFKAGKIAICKIREYFSLGLSFNQETTLCGQSVWKNIRQARQLGYRIEMYYVGVQSVEIAKERIRGRVLKGGHGIPDADVERRFIESIENLQKAIQLCDVVEVFDNTETFIRVARFECGQCVLRTEGVPDWVP